MVELPDELEFGTQQEPHKWLPSLASFEAAWSSGRHALAIMTPETQALLRERGVPMFPLAQGARRVVVANFPKASP